MSSAQGVDAVYYQELLRPLVRGQRFILIGGPIVGLRALGLQLMSLGAERPFLLGEGMGTGTPPHDDEACWYALHAHGDDIISGMRAYEEQLRHLPAEARSAIDAWDPDQRARVVCTIFLGTLERVADRPFWGRRPPSWAALEDKVVIDALWDGLAVPRAPSEIVAAEPEALRAAASDLDRGLGTAWAGDASEGVNGGAVYLRWVRAEEHAREAEAFFAAHCERVRVMPFLEGIPCSIHGFVLPGGVCVLRPVEMVTLRRPEQGRLLYAGAATYWDPPDADREEMRALARRVGEGLREQVGLRGPFTVDGILSEQGFLPTELNPRFGAGLSRMAGGAPELPLAPLTFAAIAGEDLDYRAADLEALLLASADGERVGGGWTVVDRRFEETARCALVERKGGYRRAAEGEDPDADLLSGPASAGGFVRFTPERGRVAPGPSIAPRVIAALAFTDRELGTGIGPLEPAREVR